MKSSASLTSGVGTGERGCWSGLTVMEKFTRTSKMEVMALVLQAASLPSSPSSGGFLCGFSKFTSEYGEYGQAGYTTGGSAQQPSVPTWLLTAARCPWVGSGILTLHHHGPALGGCDTVGF